MSVIRWFGNRFNKGLYNYLDQKEAKLAERVKERVKQNAPIDTGALRASITVNKVKKMEYRIGSNLDYAMAIEYGSSSNSAQPYFRPAINSVKGL